MLLLLLLMLYLRQLLLLLLLLILLRLSILILHLRLLLMFIIFLLCLLAHFLPWLLWPPARRRSLSLGLRLDFLARPWKRPRTLPWPCMLRPGCHGQELAASRATPRANKSFEPTYNNHGSDSKPARTARGAKCSA